MRFRVQNSHRPRGAVLAMTAIMMTALLGAAAIAVDQSVLYLAREQAQDNADAAALAGAQLLPDTSAAQAAAAEMMALDREENTAFVPGTAASPSSITLDDGFVVPTPDGESLVVSDTVDAPLTFGPAVGFDPSAYDGTSNSVSVNASASVYSVCACGLPAGVGLAPFGLVDDPTSTDPTTVYLNDMLTGTNGVTIPQSGVYQPLTNYPSNLPLTLKLNIWTSQGKLATPGNVEPLTLQGSNGFETDIRTVSADPLSVGQTLSISSGASASAAEYGVTARLNTDNADFTHYETTSPAYDNWWNGAHNPQDAHILILPVIKQSSPTQEGPLTVVAFATFFVEEPLSENNDIAEGRFIGLSVPGAGGGACMAAGIQTAPVLAR